MSLAWSTIALLIILLPGFLFFIGLYLPEDFSRETAPGSPLGQLAAVVLISFAVHGGFYVALGSWGPDWVPRVHLGYLLQILQVEGITDAEYDAIVANIHDQRWVIFGYILLTSLTGLGIGYEVGCLIVAGPLRRLAQHAWVFDLKVEGGPARARGILARAIGLLQRIAAATKTKAQPILARLATMTRWPWWRSEVTQTVTVAYVVTDLSHDERYLMYRGFLKAFGLSKDGKPLYLVLSSTRRAYLELSAAAPRTTATDWRLIGGASEAHRDLPGPPLSSYFVISGDHITNVVFDRHSFRETGAGRAALRAALLELAIKRYGKGKTP